MLFRSAKCHTGATSSAGFPLFTLSADGKAVLRELSRLERKATAQQVKDDRMPPPDKSKLTPEGKAALLKYLEK